MPIAEKLITEHLDTWTGAIKAKSASGRGGGKKQELYGINKLRELILELAVRGMLVPQDPNDEPASELLKRIEAEKAEQIKEGKIKKQKALAPVEAKSLLSSQPTGWELVKLGNLLNRISNGFSGKQDKSGNGHPLTRIETISDSTVNLEKVGFTTNLPEEKRDYYKLHSGDILLSHINSDYHVAKTAVFIGNSELYHGVNLLLLRPSGIINTSYVDLCINQLRLSGFFLAIAQHAIGQSSINQKKIVETLIPLPPLAEQTRIVAKVDELMALCDQLEQQQADSMSAHTKLVSALLEALTTASEQGQFSSAWQRIAAHFDSLFTTESSIEQLKQTILQLAVMGKLVEQDPGDEPAKATGNPSLFSSDSKPEAPFKIPPAWTWSNLDQLATINGGFAFKSSDYSDEGTRVVRISDFDEYGFKDAKIVRHSFSPELIKFSLRGGDILMAMTGGTVGKSLHVRALTEPMLVNQRVATIRASEAVTSNYLNILIQSELTQEVIREAKNSTNDNISMRDIKGFLVPLPPLPEQHRIVAKVDELMSLCDRLQAQLKSAQATQLKLADCLVEQATVQA
jgi:type I restriction enzyme S subunit